MGARCCDWSGGCLFGWWTISSFEIWRSILLQSWRTIYARSENIFMQMDLHSLIIRFRSTGGNKKLFTQLLLLSYDWHWICSERCFPATRWYQVRYHFHFNQSIDPFLSRNPLQSCDRCPRFDFNPWRLSWTFWTLFFNCFIWQTFFSRQTWIK